MRLVLVLHMLRLLQQHSLHPHGGVVPSVALLLLMLLLALLLLALLLLSRTCPCRRHLLQVCRRCRAHLLRLGVHEASRGARAPVALCRDARRVQARGCGRRCGGSGRPWHLWRDILAKDPLLYTEAGGRALAEGADLIITSFGLLKAFHEVVGLILRCVRTFGEDVLALLLPCVTLARLCWRCDRRSWPEDASCHAWLICTTALSSVCHRIELRAAGSRKTRCRALASAFATTRVHALADRAGRAGRRACCGSVSRESTLQKEMTWSFAFGGKRVVWVGGGAIRPGCLVDLSHRRLARHLACHVAYE